VTGEPFERDLRIAINNDGRNDGRRNFDRVRSQVAIGRYLSYGVRLLQVPWLRVKGTILKRYIKQIHRRSEVAESG
jgi:hypothetical protein